ncbi:MAG: hypothetical protein Q8P13_01415 [bacterium]|nr:hypothetical protein [bacterium]
MNFKLPKLNFQSKEQLVSLLAVIVLTTTLPLVILAVLRARSLSVPAETGWETGITAIATDSGAYHYGPNIWGTKIVWTDYKGPGPEANVWLYDTLTKSKRRVTNQPYVVQSFPDIYQNKIVWQDNRGGESNPDIYLFDLATNTEKQLTDTVPLESPFSRYSYQAHPSIYGDKVVYTDYASGQANTTLYDLSTQATRSLTSFPRGENWPQFYPKIYKNLVVWEDRRHGKGDIYLFDLEKNKETRITSDDLNYSIPDIWNDYIVYEGEVKGRKQVFLYNLKKKSQVQITNTSVNERLPKVWRDRIVWSGGDGTREDSVSYGIIESGGETLIRNLDIFQYNLETGKKRRLSSHFANQLAPIPFGYKVVFTDLSAGFNQVYLFENSCFDLNYDGLVDKKDLDLLAGHFGEQGEDLIWDLNGDGKVNSADQLLIAKNKGVCTI